MRLLSAETHPSVRGWNSWRLGRGRASRHRAGRDEDNSTRDSNCVVGVALVVAAEQRDVDGGLDAVRPVVGQQLRNSPRCSASIASSSRSIAWAELDVPPLDDLGGLGRPGTRHRAHLGIASRTSSGTAMSGSASGRPWPRAAARSPIRSRSRPLQAGDDRPQVGRRPAAGGPAGERSASRSLAARRSRRPPRSPARPGRGRRRAAPSSPAHRDADRGASSRPGCCRSGRARRGSSRMRPPSGPHGVSRRRSTVMPGGWSVNEQVTPGFKDLNASLGARARP